MNNNQLARAIINNEYTERSAEAFVRDYDRLDNARAEYLSVLEDLGWAQYGDSADGRRGTLEVLVNLGLHDALFSRLSTAVSDTYRAQEILHSNKYNTCNWTLVCKDCYYVFTENHETWQQADERREELMRTPDKTQCDADRLVILPAHVPIIR